MLSFSAKVALPGAAAGPKGDPGERERKKTQHLSELGFLVGDGVAVGFCWFPLAPHSSIDRIGRFRQFAEWEKKPAPRSGPWHR